MRDIFPGHYSPGADAYERMWEHGTFCFDANVLLSVFRLSEGTVTEFLGILERLSPRLWLPHQAAAEYHRNLADVIAGQQRPYSTAIESLQALLRLLENPREHPFVSTELFVEVSELFVRVEDALKQGQERILGFLTENPLKEKLADLFEGKVGSPFAPEVLNELYKEGAARYADRVPPGYKDEQKPEPGRYGDLFIWKQLLEFARVTDKPLIFVTGDVKEDWFLRAAGRTIGPRPELVKEFRSVSPVEFHIYTTTMFLQSANTYLAAGVPDRAIQEVRQTERKAASELVRRARFDPRRAAAQVCEAVGADQQTLVAVAPVLSTPYLIAEFEDGLVAFVHRTKPDVYVTFAPQRSGGYTAAAMGPGTDSQRILIDFNPEVADGVLIDAALGELRRREEYRASGSTVATEPEYGLLKVAPGDAVRHPSFGDGTVLMVSGVGANRKALIDFGAVGKKTLILLYARLQRSDEPGGREEQPSSPN